MSNPSTDKDILYFDCLKLKNLQAILTWYPRSQASWNKMRIDWHNLLFRIICLDLNNMKLFTKATLFVLLLFIVCCQLSCSHSVSAARTSTPQETTVTCCILTFPPCQQSVIFRVFLSYSCEWRKVLPLIWVGSGLEADMEKLSRSLAVLAEIFEEVAEISREGYSRFVIILVENNIECFHLILMNQRLS